MTVGVIIGKFYPLHRGHQYLIDAAAGNCDELHIMIAHKPGEKPDQWMRRKWMKELYPEHKVHMVLDNIPDTHEDWAAKTIETIGKTPDIVFTSEDYGPGWAKALGCTHCEVDMGRLRFPISGSEVRENPLGAWNYLSPPVKQYYAKRIVIVGAESTGKTTLAAKLAYGGVWVPEWARLYGEHLGYGVTDWERDHYLFVNIANNQPIMEKALARQCNGYLICDTDLLATSIWYEAYNGFESTRLKQAHQWHLQEMHEEPLYLLSTHDTKWVQDGVRNRGEDGMSVGSRPWFTERFRAELRGKNVVELSGSWDERLGKARLAIDSYLAGDNNVAS